MVKMIKKWVQTDSGATAIEYALIAAGVSLAVAGFVFAFGDQLYAFFGQLTGALDGNA